MERPEIKIFGYVKVGGKRKSGPVDRVLKSVRQILLIINNGQTFFFFFNFCVFSNSLLARLLASQSLVI